MTEFRVSQEGILGGYSGSGTTVTVPSTVSSVGYAAFRNMPVTSVTLPAATTEIRAAAFAECSQLAAVTIPTTQKFIAADAFDGTQVLSQPYNPQIGGSTIQWSSPSNAPRTISSYTLYINGQQSTVGDASMNLSQLTNGITNTIQISASDALGQGVRSSVLSYASTGMPWKASDSITCAPAVIATSTMGDRIALADVSSSTVSIYETNGNTPCPQTGTLSGTGRVLSIAMGANGKTVVVARSTDVRIYTETAGTWSTSATLAHPNGCVAISMDGQTVAIGSPAGDGAVSLYQKKSGTWTLQKTLYGTMDSAESFGCSVALSANGGVVAVGAKYALGKGAVRIFSGSQWKTQTNLYGEEGSSEQFGYSVALSADGCTLAVGSPCMGTTNGPAGAMAGHGRVTLWSKPVATWTKDETFYGAEATSALFGSVVAMNATGTTLFVSSGAGVRVYAENAGTWPLVGSFAESVAIGAISNTGDKFFCGTTSSLKSYTYRTVEANIVPSITTLLSAVRVQNAVTAEAAAQNLLVDLIGFEQASNIILSMDFISQFAAALPTTATKKQASLATLLVAGNLLTESQNELKAAITTACTSTLQFAADSYIGISQEYVSTIIQSAEHVGSYNPASLYVYFPSSTSITVNSAYANAVFYLEPGVTYTAGSTTLNYRRRSELQQLLLALPNSATFTAPFRAPNPVVPLFSPAAQRYRRVSQYGQDSLLESATYWQQQTLSSPTTLLNYEMLAWIAVDMLLSADTTTHQFGTALAAKFLPIARGLRKVAAFNDGGDDATLDSLPTGYFVGATDGSVAYPETLVLTHTAPLKRIDTGAFDSAIRTVVINGQSFTVQNGNITLPYDASRIWSINVNGLQILLPGAPTHVPAGGIIDISANVAYIPAGYFAGCSATHVRFEVSRSTDMQVIGAGAFPATSRLIVQGYPQSQVYYPYNTNGTNLKELTRLSGVFYSDYETNPVRVWYPPLLSTTDMAAVLPDKTRSVDVLGVSGMEYTLPLETGSDCVTWVPRIAPINFDVLFPLLTYGGLEYTIPAKIPFVKSSAPLIKLLQTFDSSYTELPPYTNGARSSRKSNIVYVTMPTTLKDYSSSSIVIPHSSDFTETVVSDSYIGDTLTTQRFPPATPRHYLFTNADLADGQVFYYGNLGWTNSADSAGLRVREMLTSPATGGAVYLMPGAHSLHAYMFSRWAPSVTSIHAYNPSMSIITSIPAFAFKNCINMATHGFTLRDSIGASAFENCASLTTPVSVSSTGGMTIGANAFKGCTGITSVTIDCSGAVSIAANAFKGCTGITSVTIRGSTVSIDPAAFTGCTGVQSIIVKGLTSSSPFPFTTMTGLQTVQIGTGAGLVSLSTMAGLTSLTSVITTGDALSIASNQFAGCSALQTITIGNMLTGLGINALSGCSALRTLTLSFLDGADAYMNTLTASTALTSIQISGGARLVVFQNFCEGLTSLSSVNLACRSFEYPTNGDIFGSCSGLQTMQIAVSTNPTAGVFQISGTLSALKTLSLTGAITVGGDAFWANSVLESLTIRGTRNGTFGTLPSATIRNINVNHAANQTIFAYQYANWPALENVNITPLVDISEGAFFGCTNLQTFNFDVTTSIDSWAFAKTGLSGEVVIPNTLVQFGKGYFLGCPNLRKITYLCDLLMFNDPTTFDGTEWHDIMYDSADTNGINNYSVTGTATITRGLDLSYNLVYAPSTGGSDVTISNDVYFRSINKNTHSTRYAQLNEMIKIFSDYYEKSKELVYKDNSGNITNKIAYDTSKDVSDYPVAVTPNTVTMNNRASCIQGFLSELQTITQDADAIKNTISDIDTFGGWNGTRFADMDASANAALTPTQYADYESKFYPAVATHYSAARLANQNLFVVNGTDPSMNCAIPYSVPISNCIFKLPQTRIDRITDKCDVSQNGVTINILWTNVNPSIVLTDDTIIDISGNLSLCLTTNASSNRAELLRWLYANGDELATENSVAIYIRNVLTTITEISHKYNTIVDISCSSLTIYDVAMPYFNNSILNIFTPSVAIGNEAFHTWVNGSTLNLAAGFEPCVGVNIFRDSDNITINSNKFLINTPIVTLVDFSTVTLDDVPAIIEAHTDVSANLTRDVEIGTYMPASDKGFPRGYTFIKFQAMPTMQIYILLQKPEDWFWAHHEGTFPYDYTGKGGLKYINTGTGGRFFGIGAGSVPITSSSLPTIFQKTGLMHSIAPTTFSFMGYRFTRNVSFDSAVNQPNTYFRAIKNNGDVQKKALFRNSGAGRLLYQAAPILIDIAVQLLVMGLTAGFGAAFGPLIGTAVRGAQIAKTAAAAAKAAALAKKITAASKLIVGGALEIGAAFLSQAAKTEVETGIFMLGDLTPLFWVEVALGGLSVVTGILKLLRLIKLPGLRTAAKISIPMKGPMKGGSVTKYRKWPSSNPMPPAAKRDKSSRFIKVAFPPVRPREIPTYIGRPAPKPPVIVIKPDIPKLPDPPASIVSNIQSAAKRIDDIEEGMLPFTVVKQEGKPFPILRASDPTNAARIRNNLSKMKSQDATYKLLESQLKDAYDTLDYALPIFFGYKTAYLDILKICRNILLTDIFNDMVHNLDTTSAAITYNMIQSLKTTNANYAPLAVPVTLNQYAEYTAQTISAALPAIGLSGETSSIGEQIEVVKSYMDAYSDSMGIERPPYIYPVTGNHDLDIQETNSCYQITTYQSVGTNYDHPYCDRIAEGYPCKPALTAGPLLTRNNYLWKQTYIGSPRTANNLEYNDLWPGNLWHSYDYVCLTVEENIDTELYLGNRTVEYTTNTLERPNLVYGGAKNINIIIPNGITSIPAYAFNSTEGKDTSLPFTISSVLIPSSVTSIGVQAFYRSGLKGVIYPSTATVGAFAFANAPIERTIALSTTNNAISTYTSGGYTVSLVTNVGTRCVTSPGAVAVHGFTSAQIMRGGVTVDTISNGAGKWLYLQNIEAISDDGLTIYPKQVLSYNISPAGASLNGTATYDNVAFAANKRATLPLEGTNQTTTSIQLARDRWYNEQTYPGLQFVNRDKPYAPFSSFKWGKTTMNLTFAGVLVVRTGSGTTSTAAPRVRAAAVSIAPHAFMGNQSLMHCDISPYCTEIGESAFQGCENLRETVVLPDGLVKLGANAFAGTNIAGIVIPSTVTEIEAGAIPATANIVLLPNESDEISPGFLVYSAEHMAETNTVFCASASVLRRLARTVPHSQLRMDTAPVQPVNVTAAPSDGCVSLTWNDVPVFFSSGATSHRVECTAEGETAQMFEGVSSPFTVPQLTNGVEYTFSVTAVNGAGNSGATMVRAIPVGSSVIHLEIEEIKGIEEIDEIDE